MKAVESKGVLPQVVEKQGCGATALLVQLGVRIDLERCAPTIIDYLDVATELSRVGIDFEVVQDYGSGLPTGLAEE